jgi:hypothetical protein
MERVHSVKGSLTLVILGAPWLLLFLSPAFASPKRTNGGDAGAARDAAPSAVTVVRDPPDPTPLLASEQWVFDLQYARGDVLLLGTTVRTLDKPVATSRAFGRFALELWDGDMLVERVRFDFPLLGAGVGTSDAGVDFSKGLVSRIGVVFPKVAAKTDSRERLVLVDRATGIRRALVWPVKS